MPFVKGYKMSEEHRRKMIASKRGKKHSAETKKKMSIARKANPTKYWEGKVGPWKGKKRSEETKRKISETNKKNPVRYWLGKKRPDIAGENNNFWRGGTSSERIKVTNTPKYQNWRKQVFERDDYTCQECGKRGTHLEAHHIKPFTKYPKLRFVVSNGITLCKKPCHTCHSKTIKKEYLYEKHFKEILENKK